MNQFSRFAKTKDGKVHGILSDNEDCTMDLVPESQWSSPGGAYDGEYVVSTSYPYDKIAVTDTNLALVRRLGHTEQV